MKKSRVLWILWLIVTALFCAAADGAAGWLLAAVSLILPLLSGLFTRMIRNRLQAEMTMAAYGQSGEVTCGKILLRNRSFLPADRLLCLVGCENLLTGEKERVSIHMAAPARMQVDQEIRLKSRHCGRVRLTLRQVTLYDPFGLFRFRIPMGRETQTLTLFAPETFPTEVQIAYGESTNMDSDEYSMKKAGYDPSETFAIREYRQGDRIRQIHWKLTEKFGDLMVRDYGLPIQNTILLLLETGRPQGAERANADCLNALAGAILSVSQELASQQIVHTIGWQNHEENTFTCMEVESDEDLNQVLPGLLGAVPGEDEQSVAEHYLEGREQLEFAHVVLFTEQHRSSLSFLAEQCLLTEVICEENGSGYDQRDGIAVLSSDPGNLEESFAYLEI